MEAQTIVSADTSGAEAPRGGRVALKKLVRDSCMFSETPCTVWSLQVVWMVVSGLSATQAGLEENDMLQLAEALQRDGVVVEEEEEEEGHSAAGLSSDTAAQVREIMHIRPSILKNHALYGFYRVCVW